MRPKFTVKLLLLAVLVCVLMVVLKPYPEATLGKRDAFTKVAAVGPEVPTKVPRTTAPVPPETVAPIVDALPPSQLAPEPTAEAVSAKVDRLMALSMKGDAASLDEILDALTNSIAEIREAAREAAKQFGDTNAIPALKDAANTVDDLKEKIAFYEAADFLTIPPLEFNGPIVSPTTEQLQMASQREAEREARHPPHIRRSVQDQPQADSLPNLNN